jgi:hypothetical protein
MKKLLIVVFFLLGIQMAVAKDSIKFQLNAIENTEFEAMFQLVTQEKYGKVILDCQSFIQGINFYRTDEEGTEKIYLKFYLDSYQCEDFFFQIKNSLNKKNQPCIELNISTGEYSLDKNIKECS